MSERFDVIDLNSVAVPAESNDAVYGVNRTSETTVRAVDSLAQTLMGSNLDLVRVAEGLGSVCRGNSVEAEIGHVGGGNSARVDDMLGAVQSADNGTVVLDLEGKVLNSDAYGGDKNCTTSSEKAVVDLCKVGAAVGATHCFKEGEDQSAGLQRGGVLGNASGSLQAGVKPECVGALEWTDDRSLYLGTSDEDGKFGSRIGNPGIEVEGEMDILAHLAYDTVHHLNEPGTNGNHSVASTTQTKDIQQPVDAKKRNAKQAALDLESQGKESRSEKESQFNVSDLVWGKVRSHPWWPGQIFDPSSSSEKARRYTKKNSFLIAYFGDQTFAWNEASQIKPFQPRFSQMEKQSNQETFCLAVNCALEEVSRRLEFGLACSCLSEEVYDKIKTQVVFNAGIREESSRRDGGDEYSSAASFAPVNLVQYLKGLAQSACGGADKLAFTIARAQLLAFNRWEGFYQLPEFKMCGVLLEDCSDVPVTGEGKYCQGVTEGAIRVPSGNEPVPLGKGKVVIQDSSSQKRKEVSGDGMSTSKKKRRLSDLMSSSHSNGENEAGMNLTSFPLKKRKLGDTGQDDSMVDNKRTSLSPMSQKQFSRVGESIRRVASQLAASTRIFKVGSRKAIGVNGSNKRTSSSTSEVSRRRTVIPVECPPPDKMLSQLYVAARVPKKGINLTSAVSFFTDFRNSICVENLSSHEHKKSKGKVSGKKKSGKKLSNSETTETSGLEGTEDTYWTDRIVQSSTEDQVLFEPETLTKNSPPVEVESILNPGRELDPQQETSVENCEVEGKPTGHLDEKCEEEYTPTALILNFTDLESVPSSSKLNKIFSHYGPLNESDTDVLKKSKRVKVVFKKRCDAETAFSSAGKFSIFGPSLVSYRLHYSPSTPRKTSTSATKRSRKGATSMEDNSA